MTRGRAIIALLAASVLPQASGYHYFTRYLGNVGSTVTIPERFDLNALPYRTVSFYVADSTPQQISQPEAFPSVLGVIREACAVWNAVPTSDLRVAFGGLSATGTAQTTPGADIVFEELDPLTLGIGGPSTRGAVSTPSAGSFVPILRSQVRLNRNLAVWTGSSFTEAFFLTVTHEIGHALGLQHTFTASTMSTDVTRSTSMGLPLDQDDIAGISVLYPVTGYSDQTGVMTGRVTFQDTGDGVHLASVVALRPNGSAISALTDRDGRFRLAGMPPNSYQVYVHPLPSSGRANAGLGDIVLPRDPQDRPLEASAPFDTVFYSGGQTSRDYRQASFVSVAAGQTVDTVNLAVRRRAAYRFSPLTSYVFFGQTAVRPAFLNNSGSGSRTIAAFSRGLVANNLVTAGLDIQFLGGTPLVAANGIRGYATEWLAIDIQPSSMFGAAGPRHMVVALGDDIYIRPNAIRLVSGDPPALESVTLNADRTVSVHGQNLRPETAYFVEGIRAITIASDPGTVTLAAPPGLRGFRATVTAVNPDGQNSSYTASGAAGVAATSFSYDIGDPGTAQVTTTSIAAGAESLVEVTGVGTTFSDGFVALGFGTSDIQVRRVWVANPGRVLANVWVAPDAAIGPTSAALFNGFRINPLSLALQIRPFNPSALSLNSRLLNSVPGQAGVFPGALVALTGANLANAVVTIGEQAAEVVSASATQLIVRVPGNLPVGPALLRATSGPDSAVIVAAIEPRPPQIIALDPAQTVRAGDLIRATVTGLTDTGAAVPISRLRILCGGIEHPAIEISPAADSPGAHRITFILSALVTPGAQVPLTVAVDGRTSSPLNLSVGQ
ncbi:MAG: matrixin family metalloprotease [Bryobacteraceae bacterium]